ncbi:retrotransposon protein, putative, ty3-gypsy subclass [Tanacetum coccineum]
MVLTSLCLTDKEQSFDSPCGYGFCVTLKSVDSFNNLLSKRLENGMCTSGHASHWSNYLGELIREMPLYYPSWQKVPTERNAAIVTKIGTQFDLTPHMQSQRWADINAGIQQHLQKLYNTNKASLKAAHWVINPETGTYDVETIRQGRPESITPADWDAQIAFWNDPRNQARAAQNRQNRAKSTVVCRQGSRSLARLRDEMMASSETREYPSLIDTFFVTHTVNGVFIRDEDRAIYEEMVRLRALGSNTESGVPYTDEEINAMARKGKQRGHLPGVGRVLPGRARDVLILPPPPPPQCTHNSGDVEKLKKKNKYLTKQVNLMMKLFRSDDKFSQMLTQYESTPEFGSGSGGCGDDEIADDEDGGEDEEDEEDGDSTSTGDIGKPEQFLCGHSATANAYVDNVGNTVVGNHGPSDQYALTKTQCIHRARYGLKWEVRLSVKCCEAFVKIRPELSISSGAIRGRLYCYVANANKNGFVVLSVPSQALMEKIGKLNGAKIERMVERPRMLGVFKLSLINAFA